jgi:cell division cycle 2-like protein
MASQAKSRWADDEGDAVAEAQRRREKEERKRAKAEKQRRLEEAQRRREEAASAEPPKPPQQGDYNTRLPPAKRRKLSVSPSPELKGHPAAKLLRFPAPSWGPCRHISNFERLNHIEEGSYGWVSRARETATGGVVALKKLKMDNANDGFPVTGLREIQTLMESRHPNIVHLREVVMGDGDEE